MESYLYLNGKPLVKPPQTIEERLNERLERTGYKFDDIVRMNERAVLQIIDLDGLSSGYLKNNELFQMLKQQIMDWNEKVILQRTGQIEIQDAYVHDNLYRNLRSQLQEVANSRNRQQQADFLNKVANWFFRQLPKSQSQKLTQSLLEKKDSTLHFIPTDYNENMYQSSVQDYASKYRSMHPEMDPPEDRVKQYQRKNLLSDTSTRPGTTPGVMGLGFSTFTRPQTSQTAYKMVEQIDKLSRPRTNQQQHSTIKQQQSWMYDTNHPVFETFEEQQKSTRRQVVRQESPLKADRPSDRDKIEQIEGIEQEQEQDEDEELSPEKPGESQKNLEKDASPKKKKVKKANKNKYISIAPEKKTYKTDKDTEQAYQIGQKERLGEFQGTFHHYDPTGIDDKMAVARLNQYYSQQRVKEIREQREDIEMVQNMKDWANNKGRIDEMILQSGYLSTFGSQFSNVGIKMSDIYESKKMDLAEEKAYANYLNQTAVPKSRMVQSAAPMTKIVDNVVMPTQIEEEVEDFQQKQVYLENKINSQRLLDLKKARGSWLPGGISQNPNQETIQNNRIMSSSCFKNPNVQRQFSAVFKTHSIKQEADKQINEINHLKNRLASENKFVPINVLQKSIVIPQGHLNPYKIPLPRPGIMLADIPDVSKKRSKKKKSKK